MLRIIRYFESFESFIQFLYGLRRRINEFYWLFFRSSIQKKTAIYAINNIDNQIFLTRIKDLLTMANDLQINPEDAVQIKFEADQAVRGTYNLLGSGDVTLNPIVWDTDFKTGFRWASDTFYKKYAQEGIDSSSDVKIPRELSRCHHLLKAGMAYQNTGENKYASLCLDQIKNWISENPLMHSINWGCTMDVSIRAVNWIWTLGLIYGAKNLDDPTIEQIKVSLYQHGWFIYRNPEKGISNNHNHYLSDLAGQIHLGLLFNNLNEPKKWLNEGKEELFREIRMQILPSGMSYERSTNYNRLVLELILVPILLLKRNGHEIPTDIWYRLEKMFEFVMQSLKPDGTSPIIGDQDNGRLLPFGVESRNNFKYLLSLGALLFNRSDFKHHGDGFNIYCAILGGADAMERWHKIPDSVSKLESKAFPDSGLYILRKSDNYLLFNATGKSLYAELLSGTHTHSDLLSFELVSNGKTFLVDPGSYVYTANAEQRMLFRSTKMHNTVTVDGESQNIIRKEGLWDFDRNAIPDVINWQSDEKQDLIIASHTGYLRLKQPIMHKRSVCFDKQNVTWIITDELSGGGEHLFEWFFHFDIGIDFTIIGNNVLTNCTDGNNLGIRFSSDKKLLLRKDESFVSKGYGEKEPAKVLVASIQSDCPTIVTLTINPIKGNEANI